LNAIPGVDDAQVDFLAGQVRVAFTAGSVTELALRDTVRNLGYDVAPGEPANAIAEDDASSRPAWIVNAVSAATWVIGFAFHLGHFETVARLVFVATIAIAGAKLAKNLLAAIRERRVDEHILMSVSVVGALALGEWSEAAALVVLLSLSEFLESFSVERARHAIRALMTLTPTEATVRRDGSEKRVSVYSVIVGDTVIVRPGERIPLDGTVLHGESSVNEASLTGESRLAEKRPGSDVFAGTVNDLGSFDFVVTKAAGDTTLARIIRHVEEAQQSRSRSERFVDRFARYYTPVVVAVAALVTIVPVAFGGMFAEWFYRSLVVLMVGCPCALVLSTPVTILAGLARGARCGVLIKGGIHLENLGAIRTVAFDKTGTLTKGEPVVLDVIPVGVGYSSDDVLRVAAGVESRSEHLHAQAIVREATRLGIPFTSHPAGFVAVPGKGAWATVDGVDFIVGSARLFHELGVETDAHAATIRSLEDAGRSVVLIGTGGDVCGIIGIGDDVREESAAVVAELRRLRVERTAMLTGDHNGVAETVGSKVGVDDVFADLLPHEKARKVSELAETYGNVLMVGDGINDAPALASATVGVAVGGRGNDIVIETADVTLMSGNLRRFPTAIRLGQMSRRLIIQNVVAAVASKAAVLVLAAVGVATLWMAVLADVGVSLIVVLNGLRILRLRVEERRLA
jgi:Cd2+/Zn2+-exporting ATPase